MGGGSTTAWEGELMPAADTAISGDRGPGGRGAGSEVVDVGEGASEQWVKST